MTPLRRNTIQKLGFLDMDNIESLFLAQTALTFSPEGLKSNMEQRRLPNKKDQTLLICSMQLYQQQQEQCAAFLRTIKKKMEL